MREAAQTAPHQKTLLAVMWVHDHELTVFRRMPWVLFMDFTAKSNAENRPYFMATGLAAANQSIIVFRGLAPNEKLKSADMLMLLAMPRLLGKQLLRQVGVALGDECGNEIRQDAKRRAFSALCKALLQHVNCLALRNDCLTLR